MRQTEDSIQGRWWQLSPRTSARRIAVIAVAAALATTAVANWLGSGWETASGLRHGDTVEVYRTA